jgi:hypothetical protein
MGELCVEYGRGYWTYGCESRVAVFTVFADLESMLSIFLSELKEPFNALLVIVMFLTLDNNLRKINY